MNWSRFCRTIGLVGLLLLGVCAFTPLPNVIALRQRGGARLDRGDAIVVLGAEGVGGNTTLASASLRRTVQGIVLHRQRFAPLLVLLGTAAPMSRSEAEVRGELARQLGVPADAILMEARAWTTRQEAERLRSSLGARGIRRILLVTESQHMVRARGVFERAGFEVLPAPADDMVLLLSDKPEDRLQLSRWIALEFLGRVYYRLAGYL